MNNVYFMIRWCTFRVQQWELEKQNNIITYGVHDICSINKTFILILTNLHIFLNPSHNRITCSCSL